MFKTTFRQIAAIAVSLISLLASPMLWADNNNTVEEQLNTLEKYSQGRLGVALINTEDNSQIIYRGEERFAMASTSKVMAVAAVLKASEKQAGLLDKNITIKKSDLVAYSPITEKHLTTGMTLAELSAATLQYSDNTAMNKILDYLGGPAKVTQFARSINDVTYRLDRKEPELNTAIHGDPRDTTSPIAMAKSLQALTLGDALGQSQRQQLVTWLKGNTTGDHSIKAGLPKHWVVGDKTGSGDYGTTNDIAVIWPENHAPLILVVYFTQQEQDAKYRKDIIAKAAEIVTKEISNSSKTK
ncbi:class A beta-lactamase [Proteus terrae]|uniref:class A beta-lactamase n=1 Tax=Proteus terrae TaxID=1574161 RepID=UPI000BFDBC33|nr:class A beta-lactamase [Proteus terrae]ATN01618.1 class A beta-lactamase [Proteus vulgaris]MBG2835990.1 class A beta-lactamase [Proteus terrae subsp. cibarius]MBG2867366.1 class A beta-lactamase [Proteus terrae subsp. cibarius]MCO7049760.1 class A beta-lactamase [Proteus terrae]MCS6714558.1 class A beta-lactamase [Proteus terrae]